MVCNQQNGENDCTDNFIQLFTCNKKYRTYIFKFFIKWKDVTRNFCTCTAVFITNFSWRLSKTSFQGLFFSAVSKWIRTTVVGQPLISYDRPMHCSQGFQNIQLMCLCMLVTVFFSFLYQKVKIFFPKLALNFGISHDSKCKERQPCLGLFMVTPVFGIELFMLDKQAFDQNQAILNFQ